MRFAVLLVVLCGACARRGGASAPSTAEVPEPEPGLVIRGQHVPEKAVAAHAADFDAPEDTVVLHYYGSGGWGIQWGKTYVLTAPYFTNHGVARLVAGIGDVVPDVEEVRAGVAGTPIEKTAAILIGHGHVDHTGDVPALFGEGLITGKPVLVADKSTVNQLAALKEKLGCVASIDAYDPEGDAARCTIERVRVTPIHHGHAQHLDLLGLQVAAFGGHVREPLRELPSRADDYKLGNTWAYMIDLLDSRGGIAFRIHYVDAVASPPHGIAPKELLAQRDVDLHIACVPGFEQADDYPDGVLAYHRVKYVLLGHWEDFFRKRSEPLAPLRQVLDEESIERFTKWVDRDIPKATTVVPEACLHAGECGPRGNAWALPVPGETFRFPVSPR